MPLQEDEEHNYSSSNKKSIPFLLADIGEGIAEVEVLQWFVRPGEEVKQFDKVCEVQSDKATVEITSRYDGIVESIADQSEMVKVGTPLLHILVDHTSRDDDDQQQGDAIHEYVEHDKLHIPTFASSFERPKFLATPAVRKLSMEYDLDLSNMIGTGPKGRVLKADVLQLLKNSGRLVVSNDDKQSPNEEETKTESTPTQSQTTLVQDETVPIRGYNRLMVKTMTESLSIPQMCYSDEINMNQVLQARTSAVDGIKLSVLPFAIKAASLAICDYPVLNSSLNLEEMTVTYHANHNIGVAMDTPRGLAVPVVKACQNLSILEIAQELHRLKEAVRVCVCVSSSLDCIHFSDSRLFVYAQASEGNLNEADISGATFTMSNIGAIGGTYMSPIVAAPQVAIGAMGKIQRIPRYNVDNEVEEVNILQISWGGDHRVVDGATMARFSNRWKGLMENPMSMVFRMK